MCGSVCILCESESLCVCVCVCVCQIKFFDMLVIGQGQSELNEVRQSSHFSEERGCPCLDDVIPCPD